MKSEDSCPCGNQEPFRNCCEPLHLGKSRASTAEQLMRSRYTAYCTGNIDYVLSTWHPEYRRSVDRQSLEHSVTCCQWLKLKILDISGGKPDDRIGYVEFAAYFKEGTTGVMQERSRFVQEEGCWFYRDGERKKPVIPGRNDPCWCGSGKKTKKCHGLLNLPAGSP